MNECSLLALEEVDSQRSVQLAASGHRMRTGVFNCCSEHSEDKIPGEGSQVPNSRDWSETDLGSQLPVWRVCRVEPLRASVMPPAHTVK